MLHFRLFFIALAACSSLAHADWGIWDAGIFIRRNNNAQEYINAWTFRDQYLGNFLSVSNHTLVVRGGEGKVWKKVPGSDVTRMTLHYSVYPADGSPTPWTEVDLIWASNDSGAPPGSQNQTWRTTNQTVNILAGLTRPGSYRLRFYVSATGTNPNTTRFYSDEGADFIATFDFNTPVLTVNGVNANYTTTKFFVDETAAESYPVNIIFQPNAVTNLTRVEIFSNLNRRDYATNVWTNALGVVTEEGIYPRPGDSILAGMNDYYFRVWPMQTNVLNREYSLTLPAEKTGAYRLTARYQVTGNTNWFWYTDTAMERRDHAIVVSPRLSRDVVMYEINTLTIKASGTGHDDRSTFVDLWDGPGSSPGRPGWNLDYVKGLGVNWLWFQPVHPYGIDGRHLSAADINARAPGSGANTWLWNVGSPYYDEAYPYALGSPYAVKNFWEIEPRMSKGNTRADAMTEFTNFVAVADTQGVHVMLDAAFNHTAWDVELGDAGVALFAPAASPATEIRNVEARFFSLLNQYDARATSAGDIAPAPDRSDFGKWLDVKDVFFGRYAALVPDNSEANRYRFQSEEDWFDYTQTSPGYFDQITQNVWRYFGAYVPYWLEKTGHPPGTPAEQHHLGIDGLRCDFGQGLPPQAWEYIINRARSIKWSFVFMAETLDGGAPPYRSNRHFDILNENIVFALNKNNPTNLLATDVRAALESRRASFGEGLVLLNTTSHDEDNYADPWQAFLRYAALSTVDGAPMIFPGQELGISTLFGYDLMEINFGKHIPHFKTYNSLLPAWNDTDFGNLQLYPAYAAVGEARRNSAALRSSNRWFLNQLAGDAPQQRIFSVAKYETANASPAQADVVFAFVNLDRDNPQGGVFNVNITVNGSNLFGIKSNRIYNVHNIAAFGGIDPNRKNSWLWGNGLTGANVLTGGVYVLLNAVPVTTAGWTNEPFEAQFLQLFDITAPPAPADVPVHQGGLSYTVGPAVFSWAAVVDPEGVTPRYRVLVDIDGVITTNTTLETTYAVTAPPGAQVRVQIVAENSRWSPNASSPGPVSAAVVVLDPEYDDDADGMNNAEEWLAGTHPLDPASVFDVRAANPGEGAGRRITVSTEPGRRYTIHYADDFNWNPFANPANGIGTWLETNTVPATRIFVDDEGPDTTLGPPSLGLRKYRFLVERP